MPYVPRADGRGYALLPVLKDDPAPLNLTGKLYTKIDGGIAQLYFQSDDGTVYQITPGGAAVYPFQLPETATPAPLANTGKLYSKDVAGVSQLFFLDDAGTETQLTPVAAGGGQIADFVYDTGGVTAGNVYNTFAGVVAAANAMGGNARVRLAVSASPFDDATLTAGTYDVSRIQFWADEKTPPPSLWFNGANLIGSTNLRCHNIIIQHEGAGALLDSSAAPIVCVFTGNGGLTPTAVGGPVFLAQNGNLITVEFREQSQMKRTSAPVQKYFDGDGATAIEIRTFCILDPDLRTPVWKIGDFLAVGLNGLVKYIDNSNWPIQSTQIDFMGSAQDSPYGRRNSNGLNEFVLGLGGPATLELDPQYGLTTDIIVLDIQGGDVELTGLVNALYDPAVFPGQTVAREITIISGDSTGFLLTLLHENAGSEPDYRFNTYDGADLVLGENEGARLIYDVNIRRWRAFPLQPIPVASDTLWAVSDTDLTLANVSTPQNMLPPGQDTVTIEEGTYVVKISLMISKSTSATNSISLDMGGTSTILSSNWNVTTNQNSNSPIDINTSSSATSQTFATTLPTTITPVSALRWFAFDIRGVMRVSAGGTLIPQIRFSTAGTEVRVAHAGTIVSLFRLGPDPTLEVGGWS